MRTITPEQANSSQQPYESRANLLIDPKGRVAEFGSSRTLSSAADRARFHALRQWADLIIVGRKTFEAEPYSSSKIPLYVFSRRDQQIADWRDEFARLANQYGRNLLVEAGPELLQQIITADALDYLHLTRTTRESSDEASPVFFLHTVSEIEEHWITISDEVLDEERFTIFNRARS